MPKEFAEHLLLGFFRLYAKGVDLLFSLSLKPSIMSAGKVWPFSQMSTSFLIFSYFVKGPVSLCSAFMILGGCP